MKKEISLIFTRTRTPCKQGFIVLYSDVRIHETFQPRPVSKCLYEQPAKVPRGIPQYDRPYRYVQPQRVWFFVLVKKRVLYYGLLLPILVFNEATRESVGGKGGAVVRALASQQCGPGSNPGVDAICELSSWFVVRSPSPFVVGSFPSSERFFSGAPVFPSPQKPTLPNSIQFDLERTDTFKRVHMNS